MPDNANGSWVEAAERMVAHQIEGRGIRNTRVLEAMRTVPRHLFIPEEHRGRAFADEPVEIGHGQTISQPFIVALMTELADPKPASRILEIGTGCGYQTAVLATCAGEVFTIELEAALAERARRTLQAMGFANVHARVGDGAAGWPEAAPFDAVVVTAAPADVPPALVDQLAVPGRLVIPVGTTSQELLVVERGADGLRRRSVLPVRFVPLR